MYICIYIYYIYLFRYAFIYMVGRYKVLFHFEAFVHESIIILLHPLTCIARTIAIHLHVYCAIYPPPPTYLLYAIHRTILGMEISCKG